MVDIYKTRRKIVVATILLVLFGFVIIGMPTKLEQQAVGDNNNVLSVKDGSLAINSLKSIQKKGRAAKTGYSREQFGNGWTTQSGCDTRNIILNRDLINAVVDSNCNVVSGTLNDPYSGKVIEFRRGSGSSTKVQIDHVVSLSDAWQKGAQQLTRQSRIMLANDPLELLAVDGSANLEKSDGDAATWLPPNKSFRCQYVARQIAVKIKYNLWMTKSEYDVINSILSNCQNQLLPSA